MGKLQVRFEAEGSGAIQTFTLRSLKTDYIWVTDIETFEDAEKLIEHAFNDYNTVRPHSSIEYLPPDELEDKYRHEESSKEQFMERKKSR